MTTKEKILNKIRISNNVSKTPLPYLEDFGFSFDDKFEKFSEMLESVGGEVVESGLLDETISGLYPDAKVIACNMPECSLGTIDTESIEDPHALKSIDLAIVQGEFAVAENGAVWFKNASNRHRALYFIAENIVIIVPKSDIVNTMHEAYERIAFDKPGFGVFISGPSKTADIEQSLVIGAHGARSARVVFV